MHTPTSPAPVARLCRSGHRHGSSRAAPAVGLWHAPPHRPAGGLDRAAPESRFSRNRTAPGQAPPSSLPRPQSQREQSKFRPVLLQGGRGTDVHMRSRLSDPNPRSQTGLHERGTGLLGKTYRACRGAGLRGATTAQHKGRNRRGRPDLGALTVGKHDVIQRRGKLATQARLGGGAEGMIFPDSTTP
jgi:hypothetical protein